MEYIFFDIGIQFQFLKIKSPNEIYYFEPIQEDAPSYLAVNAFCKRDKRAFLYINSIRFLIVIITTLICIELQFNFTDTWAEHHLKLLDAEGASAR